jgi:type IV pilus assembly protein PilM
MSFLTNLLKDPPPAFAFEVSEAGMAFARVAESAQIKFVPFQHGTLQVSPAHDNLLQPQAIHESIQSLVSTNGRKRRAALVLPDYCARVAVLDFDNFPADQHEQVALLRFRMKKTVPFEVDNAIVSYAVQTRGTSAKKVEVLAALIGSDIATQYEAPFRTAGFHTGMVTTSSLAALNLCKPDGITMLVKISGRVLSVLVLDGSTLKLARCVETDNARPDEIEAVLHPTVAYIEDELKAKPKRIWLCGFGSQTADLARQWNTEWGVDVEPLRSQLGEAGGNDAGLLGYLESVANG